MGLSIPATYLVFRCQVIVVKPQGKSLRMRTSTDLNELDTVLLVSIHRPLQNSV